MAAPAEVPQRDGPSATAAHRSRGSHSGPCCRKWDQVIRQQAPVQLLSARLEHVIVDPALRVVKEPDLPRLRVYPVTAPDLSLFHGEPYLGITLGPERLRGRPVDTIGSSIADLIPARRKTPDPVEPPLSRHYA